MQSLNPQLQVGLNKYWLYLALALTYFKPHSLRSASSSYARFSGLSLSDIFKRGSLSNKTIWHKFYNIPIMTSEEKNSESCCVLLRLWREEDGGLDSTFTLPWPLKNTTFDQNRDFMKWNLQIIKSREAATI